MVSIIELLHGHVNILIQNYGQEVDYFEFLKSFDLNFNRIFCYKSRWKIKYGWRLSRLSLENFEAPA